MLNNQHDYECYLKILICKQRIVNNLMIYDFKKNTDILA